MNNTKCQCANCGFDLAEEANEEVAMSRIGQRRINVTCPNCECLSSFTVDWTPTVLPESRLAIKVYTVNP